MRPNTPHAVITSLPSVCLGGHFFSMSTLRHTVFGFYHTFVASDLTNADHASPALAALSRLIVFYHLHLTAFAGELGTDGTCCNFLMFKTHFVL